MTMHPFCVASRRLIAAIPLLVLMQIPAVLAQTAAPAPPAGDQQNSSQEIVTMSTFQVTTTQGQGYVSGNAATALF
jgi:hypothetical protein